MDQIHRIPLDRVQECPFNPRKSYSETALQELAASVKVDGIAQPILVRPLPASPLFPDRKDGDFFEVVFGHRRLRAARLAGLAEVPCMVRTLSDAEAARLQMVENVKRADMNAVEEADGYAALIRDHGYGIEQLIELSGKARSHIYGRISLSRLCDEARALVVDGTIGAEAALEIAKIPSEPLQRKFLKDLGSQNISLAEGGAHTLARARSLRLDKFALDLKAAIFDTSDALLLEGAGACTTCPKRSGCTPEIYSDLVDSKHGCGLRGPDVCMDPDCNAAKKAQHLRNEADKLAAGGATVVTGNRARAAVGADGKVKGAFIALKDVREELKGKTSQVTVVTIQDPRNGKLVKAVERQAVKAAGVKVKDPAPKQDYAAQQRERQAQWEREEAAAAATLPLRTALFRAVVEQASKAALTTQDLQTIAAVTLSGVPWSDRGLLADLTGYGESHELEKGIGSAPRDQLQSLLLSCALVIGLRPTTHNYKKLPDNLLALAKHHGVDIDAVKAQVQASGQAASTPGPAARAPKGAKAAPEGRKPKAASSKAAAGVKYRDPATGSTWSGRGLQPAWLKAALADGHTLAEFDTSKVQNQTDDAGSAGGSDAKGDLESLVSADIQAGLAAADERGASRNYLGAEAA